MKLHVVTLDVLDSGARLAQSGHAVAEIHARAPDACREWREASNTIVIHTAPARVLEELAYESDAVEFCEPDRDGERTAVALFPTSPNARRLLRKAALAA